jgi:hypothetical protein
LVNLSVRPGDKAQANEVFQVQCWQGVRKTENNVRDDSVYQRRLSSQMSENIDYSDCQKKRLLIAVNLKQ